MNELLFDGKRIYDDSLKCELSSFIGNCIDDVSMNDAKIMVFEPIVKIEQGNIYIKYNIIKINDEYYNARLGRFLSKEELERVLDFTRTSLECIESNVFNIECINLKEDNSDDNVLYQRPDIKWACRINISKEV